MNLSRLAVGFLGAVEIAEEHVLSVMKLSAGSPMAFWVQWKSQRCMSFL
jgi:hypothetical protein